jgi:hypothetical protein
MMMSLNVRVYEKDEVVKGDEEEGRMERKVKKKKKVRSCCLERKATEKVDGYKCMARGKRRCRCRQTQPPVAMRFLHSCYASGA